MDQSDFRNLLATPRAGTSGQNRSFGTVQPKRDASGLTKEVFKKPEFKPRDKTGKNKFGKKKEGGEEGESTGEAYRDRATERRQGVDSDFAGAEKLLSDFKARADGTDDKAAIEEQMQYLGGDEEHTILVSGLDHALLTRRKYELSKATEKSAEEVEATLDEIFEQASASIEPKKRSRDEMLSLLKASKGLNGTDSGGGDKKIISDEGLEKAKAAGRFVSIGKPSKKGKEKEVESGELKKRKKKKVKVESTSNALETSGVSTTIPTTSSLPPVDSTPTLPIIEDDFDDDIFGGVEDYKGLGSDSDSDDEDDQKPKLETATSSSLSLPKAAYFDDDDEEEMYKLSKSTAPSSVTNLTSSTSKQGGRGHLEDGEETEEDSSSMKLQPLAGSSGPSVRDILSMDEAAEKEEKRLAKKLKFAGKDKEKRELSQQQKDNRDHQLMMNHLEKQGGK